MRQVVANANSDHATARAASPPSWRSLAGGKLQRKCACGNQTGSGGSCDECRRKRLQRNAVDARGVEQVPSSVHRVLQSPGRPLDGGTRGFFERRFGHDFSQVRIHDDAQAGASAREVNALAYTVGSHLSFNSGMYAPHSPSGKGLLAHELTHVVQQSKGPTTLTALALDKPGEGAQEQEAERVRHAIESDRPIGRIGASSGPLVQRVPGSPAGGCGVCYGTPKNAGDAAHKLIQASFNPLVSTQFFFPLPGPTKLKNGKIGRDAFVDLARLTGPNEVQIGEIKPANPAGLIEGDLDLFWYEDQLTKLGFKVTRMVLPPPVAALPFPTLAPPPCPATQQLFVDPPAHGIYTYWCLPDFKDLVGKCQCVKPPPPPVRERVKKKVDEKKKVREKDPEKIRVPGPEILVPVALAALLGWAAKQAAKQGGKRILAPAYVIAAIVLIANGAEASVGLEGDDALEAMFNAAADKGTPIPEDLKQAIKSDPTLKQIALDAAKSGDRSEAHRKLGEELARVITENRDQFTEEEIKELLKVSEENRDVVPNAPVTVETLKRALEAKQKGATGRKGGGTGEGETPTPEPQTPGEIPPPLPAPAQRLQNALVKPGGKGPKIGKAELADLSEILRSLTPPLTDAEVDALLAKVVSAEGKTVSELMTSVAEGIAQLRKPQPTEGDKPKKPAAEGGGEGGDKPDTQKPPQGGGSFPAPLESDEKKKPKPSAEDKADGEAYAKALAKNKERFEFLAQGQAVMLSDKKKVVKVGTPISGLLVCRNRGSLCMGAIRVTPKNKVSDSEWVMTLQGGAKVYGENGGVCGVTKTTDVSIKDVK
jgi:hypothetical protein